MTIYIHRYVFYSFAQEPTFFSLFLVLPIRSVFTCNIFRIDSSPIEKPFAPSNYFHIVYTLLTLELPERTFRVDARCSQHRFLSIYVLRSLNIFGKQIFVPFDLEKMRYFFFVHHFTQPFRVNASGFILTSR